MAEMHSLNGYEIADKKAREEIEKIKLSGVDGSSIYIGNGEMPEGCVMQIILDDEEETGGGTDEGTGDEGGTTEEPDGDEGGSDEGTGGAEEGGSDEEVTPVVYTVTYTLTNCESREGYENGETFTVNEGAQHQDYIYAADGYTIGSVVVMMGGVDVTSTAYADGDLCITSVTGNVEITASANAVETGGEESDGEEETVYYSVTFDLGDGVTTACDTDRVKAGGTLYASLETDDGTDFTATVTMGGVDVTKTAYSKLITGVGDILIKNVSGDIYVTAEKA